MKDKLECAYCDGNATIEKETRKLEFKKESINVVVQYLKCKRCGEEYTTTELDTVTIRQLHNQYREIHKLPFPDEIISLREKYGLSAAKMSEILGFGINGYSNYEKGEIPTLANANLIRTASKPCNFLEMVESVKEKISINGYNKLKDRLIDMIEDIHSHDFFKCLNIFKQKPSDINGYSLPSWEKMSNLIIAITKNCDKDYNDKLKLNKILFYADFINYKNTGKSITGLTYRAIDWGPVPSDYDVLFEMLLKKEILINEWKKEKEGKVRELFKTGKNVNMDVFNPDERKTILKVISLFKSETTWKMVELSHKENAWKENVKQRNIISFQKFAFDIQV